MKKIVIHHSSKHHAVNSGYGRLLDFIDAEILYGSKTFPYQAGKIIASFHSKKAGNYNVGSVLKGYELYQVLKKNKNSKSIVHFLNGERDIRHLHFFKKQFPDTYFCATFHKPPAILEKTITDVSALQQLDGAIAVGANQVSFLKEWLDLENVAYIPHGVDTAFFTPNVSKKQKNTLLFVGQHLRDFDALNKTLPKLKEKIENLKVNVVIHPKYREKVVPQDFIKILSGIDDIQLRTLYQEATALYLPMENSTACNSILEAMACGLPIITSNVGGNATYLEGTNNCIMPDSEIDTWVNTVNSLLQDEDTLLKMGISSRNRSLDLSWERVGEQIEDFYRKLNQLSI